MSPAATVEERLWKVDAKTMEEALKLYPKLQAAVFPPIDVDGVSKQDITVYQLLQVSIFLGSHEGFVIISGQVWEKSCSS